METLADQFANMNTEGMSYPPQGPSNPAESHSFPSQGDAQPSGGFGSNDREEIRGEFVDDDELLGCDPKERRIFNTVFGHLKALQTAVSVPLFEVVRKFEGAPGQYRQWVREIDRYVQIAKLSKNDIPKIAHITCTGSVQDFVKRYIDETQAAHKQLNWDELKVLMQKYFGDITDPQQAMSILRQIRQKPEETVQVYAERYLRVAEEAYPRDQNPQTRELIQKQLVDMFGDGLCHDYLRMKILREEPRTFEAARDCALREQNLRRKFNIRSGSRQNMDNWTGSNNTDTAYTGRLGSYNNETSNTPPRWYNTDTAYSGRLGSYNNETSNMSPRYYNTDPANSGRLGSYNNETSNIPHRLSAWTDPVVPQSVPIPDFRQVEPMEIDHVRRQSCYKCSGKGHRAQDCLTKVPRYSRGQSRGQRHVSLVEKVENEIEMRKQPSSQYYNGHQQNLQTAKQFARNGVEQNRRLQNRQFVSKENYRERTEPYPAPNPDWLAGIECYACHRYGHFQQDCKQNRPYQSWKRGSYNRQLN